MESCGSSFHSKISDHRLAAEAVVDAAICCRVEQDPLLIEHREALVEAVLVDPLLTRDLFVGPALTIQ